MKMVLEESFYVVPPGIQRMDIDTLVRRIMLESFSAIVRLSVKSDEHWRSWVARHCGR